MHVRPILVDFIDHEVGARNQDGIGQAFAKIASPAGKRRVRARNLHSDTLKTNHNGMVIIVFLLGSPELQGDFLGGGKREVNLLHVVVRLPVSFANSFGLSNEILLPCMTKYTVSQNLIGTAKLAHDNTFAVSTKRLHITPGERLNARKVLCLL